MNRIKEAWEEFTLWPLFGWYVLAWLGKGLFYDVMIPDRPFSITGQRLKDVVWQMSQRLGLIFRQSDPVWPGIKACFSAYAQAIRAARDYKRLEAKLRPLMEQYGEPGETPAKFLERLPELLALSRIGKTIMAEQEKGVSGEHSSIK